MTIKTMHSCDVVSCSQVAEDREHISSENKCQTIATSNDPRTATVEIEPLKIPLLAPALKNLGKLLVGVLLYVVKSQCQANVSHPAGLTYCRYLVMNLILDQVVLIYSCL